MTPLRPATAGWWRRWWVAERGSVTTEAVLMAPLLVMLLVFVAVVCHRGVDARLRLDDAAHQAARAASLHRDTPGATAAARDTAAGALAEAGLACRNITTRLTGGLVPGGTITVTVGCVVDFGHALLLGVPGTTTVDAEASEIVDLYRSQAQPGGAP